MDVTLRRADPGDDVAIRALLAGAFDANPKARADFTRWQYWDNPFGRVRSWVAEDGGEVVAHWAAVPVPLVLGGRRVVGAKGVDIATAESHRGRGLFTALGRRLVGDCADAGMPALLSHPNPRSAAAVERVGGRLVARVPVYVLPLDDRWLAERFRLPVPAARAARAAVFRIGRGDPVETVPVPPPDLDALWAHVAGAVRHGIVRDAAWWRWRYADRPERPYRIVVARRAGRLTGVAAVTTRAAFGARFGFVLELLAVDAAAARGLVCGLGAAADDAAGLALAAIPRSRLAALAVRAGFRRLPRRLEPHPLRFLVVAPGGDSAALAARPWSFAWGDLDHL